ncbi:MAG: carboxypeptidase regulatory-like domain-containing protein, partial [Acidobacteria bacterium]|nr:carboxypeptidase regulatory-like domain-containing protein [Acidobacteriota bacterium]
MTRKRSMMKLIISTFIGLFTSAMVATGGWAQETTQGIRGTVVDPNGAAIPDVTITVVDSGTGRRRTSTTDSNGNYAALKLPLGRYEVIAEKESFQRITIRDINLEVGQVAVLDITLQVGTITQTLEVTAEPPIIQTTTSSIASSVNSVQMESLPLNTRSFTSFTTIQPGISTFYSSAPANNATAAQQHQGTVISAQGQRPGFVAFIQDGMDISDGSSAGVPATGGGDVLGVEGIAEFQVQTHNYSAEFGQSAGAVISYVTKSGTNTFHGSAYEYLRNDVFDSRNFFDREDVPPFKRNQFGASAGGPIRKDRTFYFGNYEGLRQRLTTTGTYFVPSRAIRQAAASDGRITDPGLIRGIGLDQPDPFGLPLPGYDQATNTFTIAPAAR